MIEIKRFEEASQIKLSLEMNGKPLYWAVVYLIDGLKMGKRTVGGLIY
jgi:hypothetical protein